MLLTSLMETQTFNVKTQRRSCAAIGVATVLGAMTSPSAMAASTDRRGYVELLKDISSAVVFVVVMANVQEADTEGRLTPDRRLEEFMNVLVVRCRHNRAVRRNRALVLVSKFQMTDAVSFHLDLQGPRLLHGLELRDIRRPIKSKLLILLNISP